MKTTQRSTVQSLSRVLMQLRESEHELRLRAIDLVAVADNLANARAQLELASRLAPGACECRNDCGHWKTSTESGEEVCIDCGKQIPPF